MADKYVQLRREAEKAGEHIKWNPDTDEVHFGDDTFTPQELKGAGGYREDGRWYVPEGSLRGAPEGAQETPEGEGEFQPTPFDNQGEMAAMERFLQQYTEGHLKSQQAQLESHKNATIEELRATYEQAVAEGKLSVRDAEAQFEERVQQIEQQAYQDAERTQLHGHQMGLQHSPQMVGMMQADQQRTQGMQQDAMSERDKRVNDIKDRMNAIKQQKLIGIDRARADYRTGMIGAKGQAQQMMGQGMFDLQRDDLAARRDQHHAHEQMRHQDHITRGQMAHQDHITRGQMGLQHELTVDQMQEQFGLDAQMADIAHQHNLNTIQAQSLTRLQEMDVQHGMNLDLVNAEFNNMLEQMQVQQGYDMAQISAQGQQRLKEIQTQTQGQIDLLNQQAEQEREQVKRMLDPNSPERQLALQEIDDQLKYKSGILFAESANALQQELILNNPNLPPFGAPYQSPPRDYTDFTDETPGWLQTAFTPLGAVANWLTDYEGEKQAYSDRQAAIDMAESLVRQGDPHNILDLPAWQSPEEENWLKALNRELLRRYDE